MAFNRNKRSVVIDLASTAGRRVFYDLARGSDVVLDNLRCGILEKLKINHEVLRRRNPKLISCWKSNPNVHTGEGRYCSPPLLGEHTEEVPKSLPG